MSRVRAVIDRIEGRMAVIITEKTEKIVIPADILPDNCVEGDVIYISFEVDKEASEKAKRDIQNLIDELSENK